MSQPCQKLIAQGQELRVGGEFLPHHDGLPGAERQLQGKPHQVAAADLQAQGCSIADVELRFRPALPQVPPVALHAQRIAPEADRPRAFSTRG